MTSTRSTATGLAVVLALSTAPVFAPGSASAVDPARSGNRAASQTVLDWETTAIRTIYTENASPVPVGALYLGFTSLAMDDAVHRDHRGPRAAATAAAVAAHDVLAEYFPASTAALDADLATSLSAAGPCTARAVRAGHEAADALIASRVGDGRGDASIVYTRAPGPGVWQPPATGMLAPWLGYVRPLALRHVVSVPGPDPLTSAAYAADYDEVRRLGSATSTERTAEQTATALFFNSNSAIMLTEAVVRHLREHPLGVAATTRFFATAHASEADSVIGAWRQKFDVGFWRPTQAIAGAADDGNPATAPEAGWTALLPVPPYGDYVSGHAALTGPVAQVIRRTLGEHTTLVLHSYATNADRTYTSIGAIERDAFNARIWGGLHFRRAMVDGYALAHRTAERVLGLRN